MRKTEFRNHLHSCVDLQECFDSRVGFSSHLWGHAEIASEIRSKW